MKLGLRASFVLLCAGWLVAGCDVVGQMAESTTHARPIEAEIEKAVGTKPQVYSANTGSVLVVTVNFSEVPALPVPSLETIARAAIVREFKKQPTVLTLSFVYQTWSAER
jgi:hypothetical protein